MKRSILFLIYLLSALLPITATAAKVTKVVITATEPKVGEKKSFKASVPNTASTEVYEVHWSGEFEDGKFVQGNDYTMSVLLRIKEGSSNIFGASSKINATINGVKARVTSTTKTTITVKYTWEKLGGENPNNPKGKLRIKLAELAAAYNATKATTDKELLQYLRSELPSADIWQAGGSYSFTRRLPSETKDGKIAVTIGITYNGVTLDQYNFSVVLPALNKSSYATMLNEDMNLMKAALSNLIVTAQTTGDDVLAAVNAAAIHGTKAEWKNGCKYEAPTHKQSGHIDGEILIALGDQKDFIRAHKTLPIAGSSADTAIDADFSALSKALHNYSANNKTTREELMEVAHGAIKNGSKLKLTDYIKTRATFEEEGKIVMYFALENEDKTRAPRIVVKMPKLRPELPTGISLSQEEWEILRLTNIERYKNECTMLAIVAPLQEAADIRTKECVTDYRLDHLRPDGSKFSTAIDPEFRRNRGCGENALQGGNKPSEAVEAWMKSKGHRKNILREDYCYFGAGMFVTGTLKYWIQLFAIDDDISSAESSTGSLHFETIADMEAAYLICRNETGMTSYVPLDEDYMVRDGNRYTIHLRSISVTVTVENPNLE